MKKLLISLLRGDPINSDKAGFIKTLSAPVKVCVWVWMVVCLSLKVLSVNGNFLVVLAPDDDSPLNSKVFWDKSKKLKKSFVWFFLSFPYWEMVLTRRTTKRCKNMLGSGANHIKEIWS